MKFLKDSGFVIKRTNYRDADRIITLYTRHSGQIELLAKGVRKITSKRASYTELLNHIQFEAVTGKRGLVLTETQLLNSFAEKRKTLEYLTSMFYICELVSKLCPFEEKNEKVFDLLHDFLGSENGTRSLSAFQRGILTHLGFWDSAKKVTNVAELNNYIESILEKRLNTHKYL